MRAALRCGLFCRFEKMRFALSPDKDEIVRISAIRVENEKEIDAFTSLVKPDNRIPQEVSKIIGITDDMVSDSPSIEEILPKLMKFIRHTVLVGYNISFDLKFLNRASKRYFDKYIGNNYNDVPELAKEFLTDMKSFRPENMAAHFGIEIEAFPQGLSECRMTKSLYENICREISRQGRGTICCFSLWYNRTQPSFSGKRGISHC